MGCVTVRKITSLSPISNIQYSAPPPTDSKPEAQNFPSQIYEFNQDTTLFKAPKYPEAPKDMYYQVPSKPAKAEKPKPIFPWEEHAPRPTRVFPEERPPSPEPEPEPEPELESEPELGPATVARTLDLPSLEESELTRESRSSSISVSESDPWNGYTRANAWDAMPEIERYVQALAQARKGKVQILHQAASPSGTADQPLSAPDGRERRPSMKLTDFPTEVERPSLPVTPAPRRPVFWGEERDGAGELPTAEGVPKQQDWVSRFSSCPKPNFDSASASRSALHVLYWRCQFCGKQNPVEKLEELQQRQSEVLQTGPELKPKEMPRREMPGSAVDIATVTTVATAKASSPGKPAAIDDPRREIPDAGLGTAAMTTNSASNTLPPARLKSILKEPSFEVESTNSAELSSASRDVAPKVLSPHVSTSA